MCLTGSLDLMEHLLIKIANIAAFQIQRLLLAPAALSNPIVFVMIAGSQKILSSKPLLFYID